MTPVELSRTVLRAVRSAVEQGELRVKVPARAVVTAPGAGGCGDYATTIALQLARPAGHTPRRVAEILSPHLLRAHGIRDVVVTGPGFLNLTLAGPREGDGDIRATVIAGLVREVSRGDEVPYGHVVPRGDTVTVRLCAPPEPRALVVMGAVARILRSQGEAVAEAVGDDSAPDEIPAHLIRPVPLHPGQESPPGHDSHPGTPITHPTRWAMLSTAPHDHVRVGPGLLVQRESNPLFRVRYAHARTRALHRNAADLGFQAEAGDVRGEGTAAYDAVGTALCDHPRVLAAAARHHDPSRLARQLVALADAVTGVLPDVLPRGDEKPSAVHRARLALVEAVGAVLADGLSLLGIDAPDHL
ncbi:ArgS-related anticodon-binding protein NrtL [Streptomyces sp. NPDC048290]|uniref:ArgS-related anticodon-binding protein NrtL n=1 Tax=Streptomyces sp. NPDC048290 TaxID=3155811 RepID=UPI0034247E1E